jgi:hypothetical protein
MLAMAATAGAQDVSITTGAPAGRIEFDYPGEAKATVEVDLGRDMFGDLFGIGDAALAGVAEALAQSNEARDGSDAVRLAAEQAAAARELVAIAKNVINEVRIRVYHGLQSQPQEQSDLAAHYDQQLQSGGWDNAVRVKEGDKGVRISIARADGSIKGLFIVAAKGSDLVLVNVTCDISPENAKQLSEAAVRSGLKAGLGKELEKAMKHMN